jgi:glycosyltransferase involved in cell wall biosynthesis
VHYTYAHASHMIALAQSFRALGFAVTFILDEGYLSLSGLSLIGDTVPVSQYHNEPARPIEVAIFCNSAIKNQSLARTLRAQKTSVLYLFHEPESVWNWQVLKSEGAMKAVRFLFSTYYSIKTLRQASGVIVCSSYAQWLYQQNYLRFNSNVYVMPLLFDDEVGTERFEQMRSKKQYVGFVGTACKAHGFDAFVNFAKFSLRKGSDISFAIATRINLASLLQSDQELANLVKQGKIRMQHGRELSNEEINQHSLECFCIWNVYRRSTQSGVLPRSYMAGTPVLASRVGSFHEEVQPGFTGEFVDVNEDPAAILATVQNLREHAADYFDECRKRFLEKFYFRANCNQLTEIVNTAGREEPGDRGGLESTSTNTSTRKTIPTRTH